VFTFRWNRRSRCRGNSVHDEAAYAGKPPQLKTMPFPVGINSADEASSSRVLRKRIASEDLLSGALAIHECLVGPGVIPSSIASAVMNANLIEKAMDDSQRGCPIAVVDDVRIFVQCRRA